MDFLSNMLQAGVGLASLAAGSSAKDQDLEQQQIQARRNQQLAEMAAGDATLRGNQTAGRIRIQGTQLAAKQHTAYANSGVDASQGTAADVQGSTAMLSELDAQTAMNNAAREAWGFKVEASKFDAQHANLDRQRQNLGTSTLISGLGIAANFAKGSM